MTDAEQAAKYRELRDAFLEHDAALEAWGNARDRTGFVDEVTRDRAIRAGKKWHALLKKMARPAKYPLDAEYPLDVDAAVPGAKTV